MTYTTNNTEEDIKNKILNARRNPTSEHESRSIPSQSCQQINTLVKYIIQIIMIDIKKSLVISVNEDISKLSHQRSGVVRHIT